VWERTARWVSRVGPRHCCTVEASAANEPSKAPAAPCAHLERQYASLHRALDAGLEDGNLGRLLHALAGYPLHPLFAADGLGQLNFLLIADVAALPSGLLRGVQFGGWEGGGWTGALSAAALLFALRIADRVHQPCRVCSALYALPRPPPSGATSTSCSSLTSPTTFAERGSLASEKRAAIPRSRHPLPRDPQRFTDEHLGTSHGF